MSTRLHIVMSEELVAKVDAVLGPGQPRADFIRRAVERAVRREDAHAAMVRAAEAIAGQPDRFSESVVEDSRNVLSQEAAARMAQDNDRLLAGVSRAEAFRRATQRK